MINKIYDYTQVLDTIYDNEEFEYIRGIQEMESEEKNKNGKYDDYSNYRVISFNHKDKTIFAYDHEYDSNENIILIWKCELDYEKSINFLKQWGENEFLQHADLNSISDNECIDTLYTGVQIAEI